MKAREEARLVMVVTYQSRECGRTGFSPTCAGGTAGPGDQRGPAIRLGLDGGSPPAPLRTTSLSHGRAGAGAGGRRPAEEIPTHTSHGGSAGPDQN